ncbi:MAG: response regulator transcription factor [Myxococcaceae bacterium]|nr:response regulator transcription factor [Myxococcaceae bacterium]
METPTSRIRVYVVEDQSKILKNQLKLLEASADLEIIGTALSGETALDDIRRLKPDVVLLDLGLPRMSGIDVTKVVKAEVPKVEILIFTIFDEEDKVLEAVQAGASGYLLKGTPADKMVEAIKEVAQGGTVIQPSLARRLLKHFRVPEVPSNEPAPVPSAAVPSSAATGLPAEPEGKKLSARETEILQLIAKGVSNNEAATMLNLSKATIRTHLEHIYRKLEVTNRVEAVTEGLRKGIIQM